MIFKIDIVDAVSIAAAAGMWGGEAYKEYDRTRKRWIKELRELEGVKDESESWLLKNRRSRKA